MYINKSLTLCENITIIFISLIIYQFFQILDENIQSLFFLSKYAVNEVIKYNVKNEEHKKSYFSYIIFDFI